MDADGTGLLAIGERHEQISEFGVGPMHGDETGDVIASVPTASLADNRERQLADVGQGQQAVAGQDEA